MTKIAITALYPDDTPYGNGRVVVKLVDAGAGGAVEGGLIVAPRTVKLDKDGEGEIDLTPSADTDPAGSFYAFTVKGTSPTVVRYIEVPAPNGTGPSEIPYAWDDEDLQRLIPDPPRSIPAASSSDAGDVLTVTDDGDGKKWEARPPTAGTAGSVWPEIHGLLNPVTASGAPTNAGTSALLSFGSDPEPYTSQPGTAETVPANGWEGLVVGGGMRSTVGSSFPVSGFDYLSEWFITRRSYSEAGQWIEAINVQRYTIGGSTEDSDSFEIAAVQEDPDLQTLQVGLDIQLNDVTTEYTYISTARPLQFNTWHLVRMALDPATAEISLWVDGALIESGVVPAHIVGGATPATPCAISVPESGCDIQINRGSVLTRRTTIVEYGDDHETPADVLVGLDPDDGADGDTTVTSYSRTWESWSGRIAAPYPTRRLLTGGSWSRGPIDVPADTSMSWVVTSARYPWDFSLTNGSIPWGQNPFALASSGSGWGLLILPGYGIEFGFGLTDNGAAGAKIATVAARPTGPATVAAVLDRDADELRFYVWTLADGLIAATPVDASGLGEVVSTEPVVYQGGGETAGHFCTYDRALTQAEITFLAMSAPAG